MTFKHLNSVFYLSKCTWWCVPIEAAFLATSCQPSRCAYIAILFGYTLASSTRGCCLSAFARHGVKEPIKTKCTKRYKDFCLEPLLAIDYLFFCVCRMDPVDLYKSLKRTELFVLYFVPGHVVIVIKFMTLFLTMNISRAFKFKFAPLMTDCMCTSAIMWIFAQNLRRESAFTYILERECEKCCEQNIQMRVKWNNVYKAHIMHIICICVLPLKVGHQRLLLLCKQVRKTQNTSMYKWIVKTTCVRKSIGARTKLFLDTF